jgi:O-methyltransferase
MISETSLQSRYLDLISNSLQNSIYGESKIDMKLQQLLQRLRHPYATRRQTFDFPTRALTMIGDSGLKNIRDLVTRTLSDNIPGDYIETGVWRGGASILIRAVLAAHSIKDRKVYVADSFEGLPKPNGQKYPKDKRDRLFVFEELAVSQETVVENFDKYGLLDDQVVFLKGFFSETLPRLTTERFALLRLDGDMYESTMDALTNLYDRLSPGGYVIVDDYGALNSCRQAVHDFLNSRGLAPTIHRVNEGVHWFQKDA